MSALNCRKLTDPVGELRSWMASHGTELPWFVHPDWLEALNEAIPWELHVWAVGPGEEIDLLLPLQVRRRGPFQFAFTPALTPYGGPLRLGQPRTRFHEEGRLERRLHEALQAALERNYDQILLEPGHADDRYLRRKGWKDRTRWSVNYGYGQSQDLSSETMRLVRKAEREGLVCEGPVVNCSEATEFSRDFERTFLRKGLAPPFPGTWVDSLCASLERRGLLMRWTVRTPQSIPLAKGWTVARYTGNQSVLWYAAGSEASDTSGAMYLLMHAILEYYRGKAENLDMGGIDWLPLEVFKSQFATAALAHRGWLYNRSLLACLLQTKALITQK